MLIAVPTGPELSQIHLIAQMDSMCLSACKFFVGTFNGTFHVVNLGKLAIEIFQSMLSLEHITTDSNRLTT